MYRLRWIDPWQIPEGKTNCFHGYCFHARVREHLPTVTFAFARMPMLTKSHIPDGPGYQEKFYFTPGDTGFKVFRTRYAVIGIGICWDQWFPEAARAMALQGAEILLYPTAIGSEPENPGYDSAGHWQRTMVSGSTIILISKCFLVA